MTVSNLSRLAVLVTLPEPQAERVEVPLRVVEIAGLGDDDAFRSADAR